MPWNLRRSWTPQPSMLLSWRLHAKSTKSAVTRFDVFYLFSWFIIWDHWVVYVLFGVWMSLVGAEFWHQLNVSHHFCPRKADCWGLQRACWDLCSGTAWPEIIGICEVEIESQTVQKISTVLLPLANKSWISWTNPKSSTCESQERSVSNMCCH